jgi:hypothetical protein
LEGSELVQDVLRQRVGLHVDEPPAEPGQVAVAHLRPDRDPALDGALAHASHGDAVAGVEAAGHVGARHDVEQGVVVAELPAAEALTEVGVEVHLTSAGHANSSITGRTDRTAR